MLSMVELARAYTIAASAPAILPSLLVNAWKLAGPSSKCPRPPKRLPSSLPGSFRDSSVCLPARIMVCCWGMRDVTAILGAIEQGDPHAAEQLLPLVYDELRRLAAQKMNQEKPGQTLQATALVHEAYLRLVLDAGATHPGGRQWDTRGHFFAAAAEAMRRILVESARRKQRVKHGGEHRRVELQDHDVPEEPPPDDLLALDGALTRLAEEDPTSAKIVQLHYFAGLPIEEVAEAMGLSRATAYRQWSYARAWLRCTMDGEGEPPEK